MKKVKPSHLECSVCKSRNYKLKRAAISTDRLELNKYCKHCRAHTTHREAR